MNTDEHQDASLESPIGNPHDFATRRLELVVRDVLGKSGISDKRKEEQAYDWLNQGPLEVRREIIRQLPALIERLKPSLANAARLRTALNRLILENPLLEPELTVDAGIREFLRQAMPYHLEHWHGSMLADQLVAELPPALMPTLLLDIPHHIERLERGRDDETQPAGQKKWVHFDLQIGALRRIQETLIQREQDRSELNARLQVSTSALEKAQTLLETFLNRAAQAAQPQDNGEIGSVSRQAFAAIHETRPDVLQALTPLTLEALERILPAFNPNRLDAVTAQKITLDQMLEARLARALPFGEAEERALVAHLERQWYFHPFHTSGLRLVNFLESLPRPSGAIVATLRRILLTNGYASEHLKPFKPLLESGEYPVSSGEAWSDSFLRHLETIGDAERAAWVRLCQHATSSSAAKPNAAWEKKALEITAQIPDVQTSVLKWLALVGKPRTFTLFTDNDHFDPFNNNVLRGFIWTLALQPASDVNARAFAGVIETSLKKIPGTGPRAVKLANAGVFALGRMDGIAAVGQLARLKARVTFKTTLKEIEKALEAAATRQGVSKADLEELSVPSCGLDRVGEADLEFASAGVVAARAQVRVVNSDVRVTWFDGHGKPLKNPPASLKKDFADDLKDLKGNIKDLEGMLSAQAVRLERFVLSRQRWSLRDWHERYLEHPVVGCVTRRLIWKFTWEAADHTSGMYHDGKLTSSTGQPLEIPDHAQVSLWHPLDDTAEITLEWRAFLERCGVTQPWKQAHREIYLLTDAERRTNTYSNRFAAHILKQHQFNQLAALRGWRNQLRLMVDDSYEPPTLELPQWGLRIEYWVEGAGDQYGVDTNETGTYLYLSTDQVRFYTLEANRNHAHAGGGGYEQWIRSDQNPTLPIPLEQIPPLVLSEALRDVDLFVGVASVGNDPSWNDGGPQGRYREYWQHYSFGELSETAQSRKALLEALVPRLKIKDVTRVDGKFLHVKGNLREYKIHLGSGNILMLPNDQYLCIVPGQTVKDTSSDLHLPFEGDRTLAVILSKAFMLAADDKISDVTITRQLRSR